MAPKCGLQHVSVDYPFMSCLLKVNTRSWTWSKTVRKVLRSCAGVHSFKMGENGLVKVSGKVDPDLLLRTLGKACSTVEVQWLQYGECCNNLFLPVNHTTTTGGYGYYGKCHPHQITYGYNYGDQQAYGNRRASYQNSYGYNYGDQQAYGNRRASYQNSYGYNYGDLYYAYDHGLEANQTRYLASAQSYDEDIGCSCRLM